MRSTPFILAAGAAAGVLAQNYSDDYDEVVTVTITDDCSTNSYSATQTDTVTIDYCDECTDMPQPTTQPGVLTTYTTVWSETCSTGLQPATYTITEQCESPGQPRPTSHLPEGYTTSVVTLTCDCEHSGSTVTLTTPFETATALLVPGALSSPWTNATAPAAAPVPGTPTSVPGTSTPVPAPAGVSPTPAQQPPSPYAETPLPTETAYTTVASSSTTVVCDDCEATVATSSPEASETAFQYSSGAAQSVGAVVAVLASVFGTLFLAL